MKYKSLLWLYGEFMRISHFTFCQRSTWCSSELVRLFNKTYAPAFGSVNRSLRSWRFCRVAEHNQAAKPPGVWSSFTSFLSYAGSTNLY